MRLPLKVKKQGRKPKLDTLCYSAAIRPKCPKTTKVCWETKAIAKHQAEYYRKTKGAKMGAYLCASCQCWHIGHMLYHKRKQKSSRQQSHNLLTINQANVYQTGLQAGDTSRLYEMARFTPCGAVPTSDRPTAQTDTSHDGRCPHAGQSTHSAVTQTPRYKHGSAKRGCDPNPYPSPNRCPNRYPDTTTSGIQASVCTTI